MLSIDDLRVFHEAPPKGVGTRRSFACCSTNPDFRQRSIFPTGTGTSYNAHQRPGLDLFQSPDTLLKMPYHAQRRGDTPIGAHLNPPANTANLHNTGSTARDAKAVLSGKSKKGWFARLLPFLGPVFIASIACVDPGIFATIIPDGEQFGYELLWVILGST